MILSLYLGVKINDKKLLITILIFGYRITLNQGFYIFGLDNTSPTFASATENVVPAVSFLMAALLGYVLDSLLEITWETRCVSCGPIIVDPQSGL
jgi:hypothetical protein